MIPLGVCGAQWISHRDGYDAAEAVDENATFCRSNYMGFKADKNLSDIFHLYRKMFSREHKGSHHYVCANL